MLTWQGSGGFSIDTSVRIEGDDRAGVERLLRYCAHPPFALKRLHAPAGIASLASSDARLVYRLPKPTLDGSTALLLTPLPGLCELLHSRLIPYWACLGTGRCAQLLRLASGGGFRGGSPE